MSISCYVLNKFYGSLGIFYLFLYFLFFVTFIIVVYSLYVKYYSGIIVNLLIKRIAPIFSPY